MWVGWNACQTIKQHNTLQNIWYLPQINESPTSILVFQKTIAKECSRKTIAVTYDLAIAKSSMQLQAEESPTYDLFINMGGLHIELAFFFGFRKIYRGIRGVARLTRSWRNTKIFIKIFHYG